MCVLIFYDNQHYVGEVLHTLPEDSDRTSTAFMEQVPKQNIFRWDKEDFDTVQKKFVMEWDVPWQAGMAEHGLCQILPEQKPYIINGSPVHSKLTLNIQKQQTDFLGPF